MKRGEFVSKIKETGIDIRPFVADQVRRYIEDHPKAKDSEFSAAGYVLNKAMQACDHVERRKMLAESERSLSDDGRVSDYFENIVKSWGRMDDPGRRGKPRLAEDTFLWFFRHVEDTSYFTEVARHVWPNTSETFMRFVYAKCGGSGDTDSKSSQTRFKAGIEEVRREFRNLWAPAAQGAPMQPPPYVTKEDIEYAIQRDSDSGIWLNPHNHYSIPLTGREKERQLLDEFMSDDRPFLICPVIAPSGAGKTRLISEWMKKYVPSEHASDWDAGLLNSTQTNARDPIPWKEPEEGGNWCISCNTLIVIDYTFAFDEVMAQIAERARQQSAYKIRLLVLDHHLPESFQDDAFWKKAYSNQVDADFFKNKELVSTPVRLTGESANSVLIRNVIAASASKRGDIVNSDCDTVISAAASLYEMGNNASNPASVRYPLFAALLGQAIKEGRKFDEWTRRDLINYYFSSSPRFPWKVWSGQHLVGSANGKSGEEGLAVATVVCVATLLRGLPTQGIFSSLPGDDPHEIIQFANRIISSGDTQNIKPFEPDILGETFLLKFLDYLRNKPNTLAQFVQILVKPQIQRDELNLAQNFLEVMLRLIRNLSADDQNLMDVQRGWEALISFLKPERFCSTGLFAHACCILNGQLLLDSSKKREAEGASNSERFLVQQRVVLVSQFDLEALEAASCSELFQIGMKTLLRVLEVPGLIDKERAPVAIERLATGLNKNLADISASIRKSVIEGDAQEVMNFLNSSMGRQMSLKGGCEIALQEASKVGKLDIVKSVICLGVDVNRVIFNQKTYLILASQHGHLDIVNFLLENGADAKKSRKNGQTAIMFACLESYFEVVNSLLQAGAVVNAETDEGLTALILACHRNNTEIVRVLIRSGAQIDHITKNGATALMVASQNGLAKIVECLLKAGATPNAAMSDGRTPLILASIRGHAGVLRYLVLHKNIDLHATDNMGKTALMYAEENNHGYAITILQYAMK